MKPGRLTSAQLRRFLALAFVSSGVGRNGDMVLSDEVHKELVNTKMIIPNGGIPHITERGHREMARLCAMGGIIMPWNNADQQ